MSNEVTSPFPVFYDRTGQPLDNGYIYIGTAGINPEVSPITVYWDSSLTSTAAQPIRTLAGYPSRDGSPGTLIINQASYSIVVRDKNGTLVFSNLNFVLNRGVVSFFSTYAALTALTRPVDGAVYYTSARTIADDGGAGNWRYDSASTATANGGTVLAIDGGGAGRFFRLYRKGDIQLAWFGITLDSVSGSVPTDNTTAVNAAMAQCAADLGGTVFCPGTGGNLGYIAFAGVVDNIYSNVLLKGAGNFSRWSDGGTAPNYSTTFLPTTAGSVFKRRSPLGSTNARTIGGGFDGIRIIGNNIATRLLEVRAVIGAKFHMQLQDAVGVEAAKFVSDVTTTDLADYAGIQLCDIYLQIRQDGQSATGAGIAAARAAHCLNIVGSINANFSFNHDIVLETLFYNGHGIVGDGDMNIFRSYRGFNVGGSGKPIYGNGPTAAIPVGWDGNVFQQYSASGTGYAQGTDTGGVTAGTINHIWFLDVGNATPRPTGGTGSLWVIADSIGHQTNLLAENLVMGAALSETNAGRALLTSSMSSLIFNGSQSHQFFATLDTPQWKQFIEATTNKMVLQPLYGAGFFGFKVVDSIETTAYYAVSGTQVVGARGAAVANAAGGATVDAEARTAINTLLARIRTHGLIAP